MWNEMQELAAFASNYPVMKPWMVLIYGWLWIGSAIMPGFYFALYRIEGSLRFPKYIRQVSLVTVLVFGLIVAVDLWDWIGGSLVPYLTVMKALDWKIGATSVVAAARDPRTIKHVSIVLTELSAFAYILLLLAFFRHADGELFTDADVPVSRLLVFATKVALITWGIWVAFNVVRLVLTPYSYFHLQDAALQIGRRPQRLGPMMADAIRMLLGQACFLIAPYIVYTAFTPADGDMIEHAVDGVS